MNDLSSINFVLTNPVHSAFRLILEQYLAARAQEQRFGAAHPLWGYFRTVTRFLSSTSPVQRRQPNLDVAWSLGQGGWASVPWVACLDRRDTTTTQRSIYVVYLFREDMSGVYEGVRAFRLKILPKMGLVARQPWAQQ
jgi:MrcB-like, N-terminal domain